MALWKVCEPDVLIEDELVAKVRVDSLSLYGHRITTMKASKFKTPDMLRYIGVEWLLSMV